MDSTTYPLNLRRTAEEIEARKAALDPADEYHWYRWVPLNDIAFTTDVHALIGMLLSGAYLIGEKDDAVHDAVMLREYVWLAGRDDVVSEMDRTREARGAGWPEIWALATHFSDRTLVGWEIGMTERPEIAEWAAGL